MSPSESVLSSNPDDSVAQENSWERASKRVVLVIYILLCIEIGTFLLVMPWSAIWDRNLLLDHFPRLRAFYLSSYLRGAISGLGLVNLWLGIWQAWHFRHSGSRQVSSEGSD